MTEKYHKAYKFRLLPTEEQKVLLSKTFGCTRFVYNCFLKEKQEHYLQNKKTLNYNNCSAALTKLKKQEEYKLLNDVAAQATQASLRNLENAYQNFFKKKSKFPKFKKRNGHNSFLCAQDFKVFPDRIQVIKFKEGIRYIKHREIKGEVCSITISKTPTNKYYASVLCELPKEQPLPKTGKSVGIDLGLKDFIVTSDGQKVANARFLKKYQKKLAIAQKHFSRKQKDSKRRERQRIKVAKIYEKITNSRNDLQHQVSSRLIKKYDLISLEDLNVKGMVKNHCLAKAISDVSWSSFVTKLKYKADWYGRDVVIIDRFYPSSKTCSNCLHIKEEMTLNDRSWICPKCNTEHDRDINASKNILSRGLVLKSTGTVDYRHRAEVRPKAEKSVEGIGCEVSKKKNIRKYVLKP